MKMMITIKFLKNIASLILVLAMAIGCSNDSDPIDDVDQEEVAQEQTEEEEEITEEETAEEEEETSEEESLLNAVEFIDSEESLSMSSDALNVIDNTLTDALSDENGTVTFFVPSNEAFADFLESLKEYAAVLDFDEELEKEILAQVLKYHAVIGGANFSTELSNGTILETLQSEEIKITVDGDVYIIDTTEIDAKIIEADIQVANGVIHIIDKVLIPEAVLADLFPESPSSLMELINRNEDLSMFAEAIEEADLESRFNDGDLTVFAPTNEAIEELFNTLGDDYNSFSDFSNILEQQALREIILGHAVAQVIPRSELKVGSLPTLIEDDAVDVVEGSGGLALQDASEFKANFVEFDIEASNGVIHTIDKILIPQKALLILN
ncbi:fasciclin domain-containing protein [Zobellia roscoffensis]|uniref:fasciclin domain-containing protein n=1 Tax=Zobellia roscoffensis TaxID=2779508 RepID=UPI001889D2BA|nr:fasciclin domain-containing protein [Zobellia roscoffensis]